MERGGTRMGRGDSYERYERYERSDSYGGGYLSGRATARARARPWELAPYHYREPISSEVTIRQTPNEGQPAGTPPTEVASQNANQHEQRQIEGERERERQMYQAYVDNYVDHLSRRRMDNVGSLLKIDVKRDQAPKWTEFSNDIINAFEDHFGIGSSRLLGDILQGCTTNIVSDNERCSITYENLKEMVSQKWKEWESSRTVTLTEVELKDRFTNDDIKKLQGSGQ